MPIDGKSIVISSVGKTVFTWWSSNSALAVDKTQETEIEDISSPVNSFCRKLKRERQGDIKLDSVTAHVKNNITQEKHLFINIKSVKTDVKNNSNIILTNGSSVYVSDSKDDLITSLIDKKMVLTTVRNEAYSILSEAGVSIIPNNKLGFAHSIDVQYTDNCIQERAKTLQSVTTSVTLPTAYRYIFNEAIACVINNVSPEGFGTLNILPVRINVENYRPPSFGNTGSGSAMRDFRIIAQKLSFVEVVLNFEDSNVLDVVGLPDGMVFDKDLNIIKGSPILSGKYPITLNLDNGFKLDGLVIVPQLPRKL